MVGYIIFGLLIVALGFVLFSPALKGLRTTIFGALVSGVGAVLPFFSELAGYFQTLDWRQYVLAGDKKNLAVLGIMFVIGIIIVIQRKMTTTPMGKKE